jgi:hypothetical protein
MRRLNIRFSESGKVVALNIPGLGEDLTWQQKILEIFSYLRLGLTIFYIGSLPLALFLFENRTNVGRESSLFAWMILLSLMITSFYVLEIVLASKYRVIDPPGSLAVLLFGLIVTSVSAFLVFTEFESPENTFGSVGESAVKALSGLTIILVLYLFYILRLGIEQSRKYSIFINALSFGFFIYVVLGLLDVEVVSEVVYVILAAFVFAIGARRNFSNSALLLNLLGLAIVVYHLVRYEWGPQELFVYLFVATLAAIYVAYFVFAFQLDRVINPTRFIPAQLTKTAKDIFNKREISTNHLYRLYSVLVNLLVFGLPVLFALTAIALISDEANLDLITDAWNTIPEAFSSINDSITTTFTGKGASIATANTSLISSIIEGLGIAGLLAYLGIFVFAIFHATKNIILIPAKSSLTERIIFAFILISIPLLGLFSYVSLLLITIWWVVFSISLMQRNVSIEGKTSKNFILNPPIKPLRIWKFRSRITESVRLIIMLTLFLICYILMYTVLDNLGNII